MKRLIVCLAVVIAVCGFGQAKAAYEFFDDFNDGIADGWVFPYNSGMTQFPGGDWSVENGTLVQHFAGDGNNGLVDNLLLSNQVIETQARTIGYAGIVVWYQQVDETLANYVAVSRNSILGLWVHEHIDGHATTYYYGGPAIADGAWYDLKVEADSATGSMAVYLDGAYVLTHVGSTPYRTGLSGLYSGNAVTYFDNFRLTSDDAAVVPEASSLAIWSVLSMVGVGYGWWRKRKAA